MERKHKLLKNICLTITSVCLLVTGICLLFLGQNLVESLTNRLTAFSPNSYVYNLWERNSMHLPFNLYIFNWTNPEEVYNSNVKLKFQQLGPYKFSETKQKVNVTWNDNSTVTYRNKRMWFHDEEGTNGSLFDEITIINPVALAAAHKVRNWNMFVKKGFSITLRSLEPTIHTKKTAGQLLFDGYNDPLIDIAQTFPFLADIPPWKKFGWFYQRNGSTDFDGVFNIGTGFHSKYGTLYNWNYQNHTSFYEDHCGEIGSSAGDLFAHPLLRNSLSLFSTDMCRPITLDYVEDTYVNNIRGYKYTIGEGFLDNGTKIPSNRCYCSGDCQPSGLVNVSSCRYGTPAFASLPHFYSADPSYFDFVEGLEPKQEKHEFYMTIEPTIGVPLEIAGRLQLNLLMQPVDQISLYQGVPKVYVPAVWFEQKFTLPNHMVIMLKMFLMLPTILKVIAIIMICFGSILSICSLYKLRSVNKNNKQLSFTCAEQVPLQLKNNIKNI